MFIWLLDLRHLVPYYDCGTLHVPYYDGAMRRLFHSLTLLISHVFNEVTNPSVIFDLLLELVVDFFLDFFPLLFIFFSFLDFVLKYRSYGVSDFGPYCSIMSRKKISILEA